MKKITTILFSILLTTGLSAQTAGEALTFSQQHYEGTARTLAMGNAFTALGGDLGAIAINPASSAIYRYSQFSLTPSFITSNGETNYLNDVYNDSFTRMAMSNLGFVMAFDTGNYSGLLNYNFGITLNRNNSFNAIMTAYGITDQSSLLIHRFRSFRSPCRHWKARIHTIHSTTTISHGRKFWHGKHICWPILLIRITITSVLPKISMTTA